MPMRRFRAGDGADLAFAESGSGQPVLLFVHGWQADHSVWHEVIRALGNETHVVAIDLRGSGESQNAAGPYELERFAADLREFIEMRGLAPVIVVGHSMGATVALRFAADAPELVSGLVLIAPVPASGGGYSEKGEAYLRATAGDPIAVRNWLSRTFSSEPVETTLALLCAAAAKTRPQAALESFDSWAYADFAEATRRIEAPALVIAPAADMPEVAERKVAALLPNARYVVLTDCAHYAILERPGQIAESIKDFFRLTARIA